MLIQPASLVVTLLGGHRRVARLLGINHATVHKWRAHADGHVPAKHQRRLIELARSNVLSLTADDIVFGREVRGAAIAVG